MAKLSDTINEDLKAAMKDKKILELSTLRMLVSALKNRQIELKTKDDLEEPEIVKVVKSEIKKRRDSIEAYQTGGRQELADKEKDEIRILEKYQPEQMSDEEIDRIVKETVDSLGEVGPGDFGRVMGAVMGRIKDRADGKTVQDAVKRILAG